MKKNKELKKIYNNIFATGEEKIFARRGNSEEILEIKNAVWASGEILLKDFSRRLPNVLRDAGLPIKKKNIDNLLNWLETEIIPLKHKSNLDGAMAVYVLSKKSNKNRKNNE